MVLGRTPKNPLATAVFIYSVHPLHYLLRSFIFLFLPLPRRNAHPGPLSRLLSPVPTTVHALTTAVARIIQHFLSSSTRVELCTAKTSVTLISSTIVSREKRKEKKSGRSCKPRLQPLRRILLFHHSPQDRPSTPFENNVIRSAPLVYVLLIVLITLYKHYTYKLVQYITLSIMLLKLLL